MTNRAEITGVVKETEKDHTFKGVDFYKAIVECTITVDGHTRYDNLNVIYKDVFADKVNVGQRLHCTGSVRNFYDKKRIAEHKASTMIYVYLDSLLSDANTDCNVVEMEGEIVSKPPELRETRSKKNLCSFMLMTTLYGDKKAYIPVITWGDKAMETANCKVGDKVLVNGRLHERKYKKNIDGTNYLISVHEVCASDFKKID